MKAEDILRQIKSLANPEAVKEMARFGINPQNTFGASIPALFQIAKKAGKNHTLALKLWGSGVHEARIIAAMVGEPDKMTEKQMDKWVKQLNSWDICDQVCSRLFDKTPFAWRKTVEWTKRKEEFVKRAGFAMMATLSIHDKEAPDKKFEKLFPLIKKQATDERNYVKKAVNWALRNIGKRNLALNKKAIKVAKEIKKIDDKTARWIASDAIRELTNEKIQTRLKKKRR